MSNTKKTRKIKIYRRTNRKASAGAACSSHVLTDYICMYNKQKASWNHQYVRKSMLKLCKHYVQDKWRKILKPYCAFTISFEHKLIYAHFYVFLFPHEENISWKPGFKDLRYLPKHQRDNVICYLYQNEEAGLFTKKAPNAGHLPGLCIKNIKVSATPRLRRSRVYKWLVHYLWRKE